MSIAEFLLCFQSWERTNHSIRLIEGMHSISSQNADRLRDLLLKRDCYEWSMRNTADWIGDAKIAEFSANASHRRNENNADIDARLHALAFSPVTPPTTPQPEE